MLLIGIFDLYKTYTFRQRHFYDLVFLQLSTSDPRKSISLNQAKTNKYIRIEMFIDVVMDNVYNSECLSYLPFECSGSKLLII